MEPLRLFGPSRQLDRDELLQSLVDKVRQLEAEGGAPSVLPLIAVLDIGRINLNFGYEAATG